MKEDTRQIGMDAVDRILDAIGMEHIPADLDRNQLAIGLTQCLYTYHATAQRNSDRPTKDEVRRLTLLRAAAKRFNAHPVLNELCEDDSLETEFVRSQVDHLIHRIDSRIRDLNDLLKDGPYFEEALRLRPSPRGYPDPWKSRSPLEWVAGYYLPELLKEQFGLPPKFHRRSEDNIPDGPMIRFVERALIELGITNRGRAYARETIAKAIGDMRTHRVRKKPRKVRLGKSERAT